MRYLEFFKMFFVLNKQKICTYLVSKINYFYDRNKKQVILGFRNGLLIFELVVFFIEIKAK